MPFLPVAHMPPPAEGEAVREGIGIASVPRLLIPDSDVAPRRQAELANWLTSTPCAPAWRGDGIFYY